MLPLLSTRMRHARLAWGERARKMPATTSSLSRAFCVPSSRFGALTAPHSAFGLRGGTGCLAAPEHVAEAVRAAGEAGPSGGFQVAAQCRDEAIERFRRDPPRGGEPLTANDLAGAPHHRAE